MRIDELTGVKKYRQRSLGDVLDDFIKAGGHWANGRFGTVLLHPRWNYVYKFFVRDDEYLRYIRWVTRNPHPCAPVVLSPPRRITPFYHRHKTEDEIYVVKLEKLNEWNVPSELDEMGGFAYVLEHVALSPESYKETAPEWLNHYPANHAQVKRWRQTKDFLDRHPEFKQLADFYRILLQASIEGATDLHAKNVMQRDDGTLVFTDPFWHGETPYTLAAAARQAEIMIDDDEPDPRDYVEGGKRWKKPRKKKFKPQPYRAVGGFDNDPDEDFPF